MNKNLEGNNNLSENNSEDCLFRAKIREEDLAQQEEIRKFTEEYNKQINSENYEKFSHLLSKLELNVKNNEEKIDENTSQSIFSLIKSILNIFISEDEDKQFNSFINKKVKEKDRLFSLFRFMKLLLRKIFRLDVNSDSQLSWQKRLIKEIDELEKRLTTSDLTKEEYMLIMERLSILKLIKFLGPVNFIGTVIRIISLLVGFALGVEVSEQITNEAKETNTKGDKAEVVNNLTYDMVNFLKSDPTKITDSGIITKFHELIEKYTPIILNGDLKLASNYLNPKEKLKFEAQKTTHQENLIQEKPVAVVAAVVKPEVTLQPPVQAKLKDRKNIFVDEEKVKRKCRENKNKEVLPALNNINTKPLQRESKLHER